MKWNVDLLKPAALFWCICLGLIFISGYTEFENHLLALSRSALAWTSGHAGLSEANICVYALDHALNPHTGEWVWTLGAFPVLLLMPFSWFYQLWNPLGLASRELLLAAHIAVVAVILFELYVLAKQYLAQSIDRWTAVAITIFATPLSFIVAVPRDHHFYHLVSFALAMALILEFIGKRRWWMLGIVAGLLMHTRFTTALILLWPLLELLFDWYRKKVSIQYVVRSIVYCGIPLIIALIVLLLLNEWRFGDYMESGYGVASIINEQLIAQRDRFGMMHIRNIPSNLYWYLVALPAIQMIHIGSWFVPKFIASTRGTSFFFISFALLPALLWSARSMRTSQHGVRHAALWATIGVIFFVLLLFYSAGAVQQGLRYALDFLPLMIVMLVLFMREYRSHWYISFLLLLGSLINILLLFGYYE